MTTAEDLDIDEEFLAAVHPTDSYDAVAIRERHIEAKRNLASAYQDGVEPELVSLLRDEVQMWRDFLMAQVETDAVVTRLEVLRDEIMAEWSATEAAPVIARTKVDGLETECGPGDFRIAGASSCLASETTSTATCAGT